MATVAAALLVVCVAGHTQVTAPANAKSLTAGETCATDHPGLVCNHFRLESEGPDYDVIGWLAPDGQDGGHTKDWREDNPKFTDWWFYYDKTAGPGNFNFHANIMRPPGGILEQLKGTVVEFPVSESHCYILRKNGTLDSQTCPS
ncbi:MAG TPA: hypothetical protein VI248_28610 [Kineosporiaceae bacterium]